MMPRYDDVYYTWEDYRARHGGELVTGRRLIRCELQPIRERPPEDECGFHRFVDSVLDTINALPGRVR